MTGYTGRALGRRARLLLIVLTAGLLVASGLVGYARHRTAALEYWGDRASPHVIVVLVHGTFAPDAAWTTSDSPLVRRLTEQLGDHALFVRFQWLGAFGTGYNNTHAHRYAASRRLAALWRELRTQYDTTPILVVAHSHGGNVALYAAAEQPDGISAIVTMGSPFISVEPRALEHDAALSEAVSTLFPIAAWVLVLVVSAVAGMAGFSLMATLFERRGTVAKAGAILIGLMSLGILHWPYEIDRSRPPRRVTVQDASGHEREEWRYHYKMSKEAIALRDSLVRRSEAWFAAYAARRQGDLKRLWTAVPPRDVPMLIMVATNDEVLNGGDAIGAFHRATDGVLGSDDSANVATVLGVMLASLAAVVMAIRTGFRMDGHFALRVVGGIAAGIATIAVSGAAMVVVGWLLVPIALVLRVPAALPDLIAYGSIDVPADYLVTISAQAHPPDWTPSGPLRSERRYTFAASGLAHSQYYADAASLSDLADWVGCWSSAHRPAGATACMQQGLAPHSQDSAAPPAPGEGITGTKPRAERD